jgi:hypothetical protein
MRKGYLFFSLLLFLIPLVSSATVLSGGGGTSAVEKKPKKKTVKMDCSKAKDSNNHDKSFCDEDLTDDGICSNALSSTSVRAQINSLVCCNGTEGALTYHYNGTPWDPCSMITVSGTGADRKITFTVNPGADCSGMSCKEFGQSVLSEGNVDVGDIVCKDEQ